MTDNIRLLVECISCKTKSVVPARNSSGVGCQRCGHALPIASVEVVEGYVYVLSNYAMPGLLKIGFTTNQVQDRVQQLNSATGVPQPFIVDAFFESETPYEDEQRIHSLLAPRRENDRREFFRAETMLALVAIVEIMGRAPSFLRPELTAQFGALRATRVAGTPTPVVESPAPWFRRTRSEGNLILQLRDALHVLSFTTSAADAQLARDEIRRLLPEATSVSEAITQATWLVNESAPQV
jgi:hypothetical protein